MSALPCPVADPFAAADQAYAKISQFLGSEEACQVKHSDLERQLEGMGRELMRKLLQAHLDLRQPGKAVGAGTGCRGHDPHAYAGAHAQPGKYFRDGGGDPHWLSSRRQAQSASARRCAQSAAREVLVGSAAASDHRSGQRRV